MKWFNINQELRSQVLVADLTDALTHIPQPTSEFTCSSMDCSSVCWQLLTSRACNSLLFYPRAFSGAIIAYPYKGQPRGADPHKQHSISEELVVTNTPTSPSFGAHFIWYQWLSILVCKGLRGFPECATFSANIESVWCDGYIGHTYNYISEGPHWDRVQCPQQ